MEIFCHIKFTENIDSSGNTSDLCYDVQADKPSISEVFLSLAASVEIVTQVILDRPVSFILCC